MGKYEDYLNRIKRATGAFNDGQMLLQIKNRVKKQQLHRNEMLIGGALAIMLMFSIYFNIYTINNRITFSDYVFQQESVNDNQLIGYVFSD